MKPLYHPSLGDITVEGIIHALSDPVRVRIYAEIARSDCPKICSNFLEHENHAVPKSTLSQHFKILREAGLIRSERKGVELHNTSRCEEIEKRLGGMVGAIIEAYSEQNKRKSKSKSRKASS
jgi:DNA-binding transcriptional ArsR family regulator